MKILVIGASGACGRRVATEAEARGHTVTRASRTRRGGRHLSDTGRETLDAPTWVGLDAADAPAVAQAARGHDVILGATRPARGHEDEVPAATAGLATGAKQADVRLIVIGGAGPLLLPGSTSRAIDHEQWVPRAYRQAAAASVEQLQVLEAAVDVAWTYLAPPALFQPGERTGTYRTGGTELVIAADGTSLISMEDFAIAALDEIEAPTTHQGVLSIGS
ncbi:NAD(P)-dependent oxidoreductase [Ornithinimicrobium faecis]|uniref:NAD(P)-dependent oxidoreductase n=1 Tax=Ornithinimicrobium faecis TaxID=2934158 RepID=UPI002118D455|nr:NAD(P)H-binding protein [Ornithinimicrobium sp. HY1745]